MERQGAETPGKTAKDQSEFLLGVFLGVSALHFLPIAGRMRMIERSN